MNVLLMGPRASGKTSIGRDVAHRLHKSFVDLDERVREAFDEPTVEAIWRRHGEAAWRDAETAQLRQTLNHDEQVIALGGGTPMVTEARALIEHAQASRLARVVYLQCPAAELSRRLVEHLGDRPSLTGADPAAEVDSILTEREPTYLALADHVVDATGSVSEVVDRVVAVLEGGE